MTARKRALAERMRRELPYGLWRCADGREVLFDRHYHPIWSRRPGQPATQADPAEWVVFERQTWLYGDRNPPWQSEATHRRCNAVLNEWLDPIPRATTLRLHAAG